MKLSNILPAAAAGLLSFGLVSPVLAAPAWANYGASRACSYLRRGYSAREAGEQAARDTINSRYRASMLSYFETYGNDKGASVMVGEALSRCPNAFMNAS